MKTDIGPEIKDAGHRGGARRKEKIGAYDSFKNISDYNNLLKAYKDAKKGIAWKTSVQRYGLELTENLCKIHNKLENEESTIMGFIPFDVMERGKLRHIMSIHFKERVAQAKSYLLEPFIFIVIEARGLLSPSIVQRFQSSF